MNKPMPRWMARLGLDTRPRLRKLVVGLIGATVFLIGLALIVLPGPAVLVIPIGLAILATEFAWARRIMKRGRFFVQRLRGNAASVGSPNETISGK